MPHLTQSPNFIYHDATIPMTDEELNKWNLRFCPKCRGHNKIAFRRQKEVVIEIIKHCQNFDKCNFRSIITT